MNNNQNPPNMSQDLSQFLRDLEKGTLRVAQPSSDGWVVNHHVKEMILNVFRQSNIVDMADGFCDKDLLFPRTFSHRDHIRFVPGGSAIRPGTYIGKNVIVMPPSYINIGAYIDEGTMVDSHVLVGSCAQIGKRVHLSAAVQIGGVLEPIGQRPVIIEDDCFLGAGVHVLEGVLVGKKAVLAPGVVLSASIPIYDIVHKTWYKKEIPPYSVVVPGSRPLSQCAWAKENNLHLSCAIIVKYRDEKTDAAVILEEALR